MPAAPEVYKEEEIPRHPALQLIANSEQVLSTKFSRRLITMQKVEYLMYSAIPTRVAVHCRSLPPSMDTSHLRITRFWEPSPFSSRTSSYATCMRDPEIVDSTVSVR